MAITLSNDLLYEDIMKHEKIMKALNKPPQSKTKKL